VNGEYREFGYHGPEGSPASAYVTPAVLSALRGVESGARILDVGCGNGALAGELLRSGYIVIGIDMSEEGIRIARATHPGARFEVLPADADLTDRLGEPPFDAVVSTEVIEHLYDPHSFLAGCHAALREDGRLVLSTPYHGYLKNLALAVTGKWDRHFEAERVGGHIKFWSRQTLTHVLRTAGFDHIEVTGAGRLPLLWKSMIVSATRATSSK
jgi:2-polyprenyl-3-methyl-5-hydroxy-6-metoxy-1,4-benzoquinol methylase